MTAPAPLSAPSQNPDRQALGLLLLLFGFSLLFAFINQNTYDSSDSLGHFMYARYAFRHPTNLLESWSKPLLVLVHTLPARAGLPGVMLVQCCFAAAAAWLSYGIARRLRLPWPWLAILFVYASPDYFRIQYSGLTEPLFSVVLTAGVALAVARRPGWAALVVSFLPFARSEGFMLICVFGVYLATIKAWRYLPLLLLGFLGYSVAGWLAYGEFWWVFGRNAYPYIVKNYGHGGPWHFLLNLPYIIGWVLYGLVWLGGIQMLRAWAKPVLRRAPDLFSAELLLVYGCIVVYVGAHSIFWWRGIFASFGLMRVINGIVPLLALVALNGLDCLTRLVRSETARQRLRQVVAVAVVAILFLGLRAGFRWNRDFTRFSDQLLAARLAERFSGLHPLVVYAHPVVPYTLGLDPFDKQQTRLMEVVRRNDPIPKGALVVWDDWFSMTEFGVPLAKLQNDPRYRRRWQSAVPRNRFKPTADSVKFIVFERL